MTKHYFESLPESIKKQRTETLLSSVYMRGEGRGFESRLALDESSKILDN